MSRKHQNPRSTDQFDNTDRFSVENYHCAIQAAMFFHLKMVASRKSKLFSVLWSLVIGTKRYLYVYNTWTVCFPTYTKGYVHTIMCTYTYNYTVYVCIWKYTRTTLVLSLVDFWYCTTYSCHPPLVCAVCVWYPLTCVCVLSHSYVFALSQCIYTFTKYTCVRIYTHIRIHIVHTYILYILYIYVQHMIV